MERKETVRSLEFRDDDWSGQDLCNETFEECLFQNIKFSDIIIQGCRFIKCKFISCAFNGVQVMKCEYTNCMFRYSNMFCSEWRGCKMMGSAFEECNCVGWQLEGGNWSYTVLRFIDFSRMDLSGMNLEHADLYSCDFGKANLSGANLRYALLTGANFKQADLRGADIVGVDILNLQMKETKIDLEQAGLLAQALGAIVQF